MPIASLIDGLRGSGSAHRRTVFAYGVALLSSVGAFIAETWLWESRLDRDLFVLSYGAVMVSAWIGGLGPGLLATAVSSILAAIILMVPGQPSTLELDDGLRIGIFALIALLTSSLLSRERRALAQADNALKQRNELIATISHDLKNPISVIKASTQLLQRYLNQTNEPPLGLVEDRIDAIDRAATQILDQVGELLDAARVEAGQDLDLHREETDLVVLARSIVDRYRSAGIFSTIDFDTSEPTAVGDWDKTRLGRVIENLVANAVKYSPNGGQVWVRIKTQKDKAIVEVQDEGIGIPARDLPYVFERFHRAQNAMRVAPGSGLGLASARHIVEQHGGWITVQSTEGVGSLFTVVLPLSGAGSRSAAEPASA